jgi:GAF domain-containing protein
MSTLNSLGSRWHELRGRREDLYQSNQSERATALLAFYTRIMTKVTESERCSVFINDPGHDRAWLKAGTGVQEAEIEVPKKGSIVGQVIDSGEPIIVSDLEAKSGAHKQVDEKTGFVTRNILCVPIKSAARGIVTGAFEILNKLDNKSFTEEDQTMALEVASHLQREVDTIFLDQETFGMSEELHQATVRGARVVFISIAIVFIAVIAVLLATAS